MSKNKQRCRETVYVRDTYRRTGRGKSGFEMHYTQRACRRTAGPSGYCWQHFKSLPADVAAALQGVERAGQQLAAVKSAYRRVFGERQGGR